MLYMPGKTDCVPSDVGYDESRIPVLHAHFQRLIDAGDIQCATFCASRHGKVFLHGAIGPHSYKDDATPMKPDAITYIASETKLFVTVAIMQLCEQGLTRLDLPVSTVLPQFAPAPFDKICIHHLLSHTSGLHPDGGCLPNPYETTYWGAIRAGFTCHDPKDGEFDWIKAALSLGVRMKPEQEWAYCSFGYVILGAIIEKLTGVHAHPYIEDNIAKPLGMVDTFFEPPEDKYDRFMMTERNEGSIKRRRERKKGKPSAEDLLWRSIPSTGGGLHGTAYDIQRFGLAVMNGGRLDGGRILGRKSIEKVTTPSVLLPTYCWGANGFMRQYGIGFDMRGNEHAFTYSPDTYCHEGAGACSLVIDPTEKLVASWFVPFTTDRWVSEALFNVQNIIWSGIL